MTDAPMRGFSLFAVAALVGCACGGAAGVKSTATPAQWDAARAIAVAHVDRTYHLPADKVRAANPRLPFLFTAALPGASAVLVHGGAVVEGGGTGALGTYLDAVDVYGAHALTADDVLDLLYVFRAFPPLDAADGSPGNYVTDESGALAMRLAWQGDAADFTLAYRLDHDRGGEPDDRDDSDSDEDDDDTVMTVALWTLHLARGAAPTWTEARRDWDYEAERFVP